MDAIRVLELHRALESQALAVHFAGAQRASANPFDPRFVVDGEPAASSGTETLAETVTDADGRFEFPCPERDGIWLEALDTAPKSVLFPAFGMPTSAIRRRRAPRNRGVRTGTVTIFIDRFI